MRWHPQKIKCTSALVLRGYRKGNYACQSPYSALMLVVGRKGKYEIQGMLADAPLKRKDLIRLSRVCERKGIRLIQTRRHGKQVTMFPL